MILFYDIVLKADDTVVASMSSQEEAYTVACNYNLDPSDYTIVERTEYTVRPGFGRDPDLH